MHSELVISYREAALGMELTAISVAYREVL